MISAHLQIPIQHWPFKNCRLSNLPIGGKTRWAEASRVIDIIVSFINETIIERNI